MQSDLKMADEKSASASSSEDKTFSVSVVRKNAGQTYPIIKNSIRRIGTSSTWFDLFDYATDMIEEDVLPKRAWDEFEKIAKVSVSHSLTSNEQFNVDPYEKINVLSDFDPNLKYVNIELHLETEPDANNNKQTHNALAAMMLARSATKTAKLLDPNKPRFNGRFLCE